MTKMNILFLDDDNQRQNLFRGELPFAIRVFDAKEAIEKLSQKDIKWDYVFIDHDLGGQVFVDSKEKNTGAEVTRWIAITKPQVDCFVIHSYNYQGVREMFLDLSSAGYDNVVGAPFAGDSFRKIVNAIQDGIKK